MGKPGLAGTPAAVVRSRIAVPALGILALALAIAVVPLDVLARQGSPAEPLVAAASFTAVGLVVARRRPRNPTGWLLAVIGILILLTVAAGYYAVLVYRLRDRLPLGPLALVFAALALDAGGLSGPGRRVCDRPDLGRGAVSRRRRAGRRLRRGDRRRSSSGLAGRHPGLRDPDLLDVVHRALEPTYASVWASQHGPQKEGG